MDQKLKSPLQIKSVQSERKNCDSAVTKLINYHIKSLSYVCLPRIDESTSTTSIDTDSLKKN